jgi:hypothetical protein
MISYFLFFFRITFAFGIRSSKRKHTKSLVKIFPKLKLALCSRQSLSSPSHFFSSSSGDSVKVYTFLSKRRSAEK